MVGLQATRRVTICTRLAFSLVLAVELIVVPSAMGGPGEACQLPMFDNPEYCVPKRPLSVAVGDLNGDGALDLAAPNFGSDNVSILLNRSKDCSATPGDLNGDGVVGPFDLASLLGSWGPCADCDSCAADLDGDCKVGPTDLAILLANWG